MAPTPLLDPPPGWRSSDGLLQPDRTVAGYLARGQEARGRCHLRDCRRTCAIDPARLMRSGFGPLPIEAVQRWMKCMRIEGCALSFHDEPVLGLPVRALLGRPEVAIRFQCLSCRFHRSAPPDRILARLRGKGAAASDDATVESLAVLAKEPCKACGKTSWRVDVLWPRAGSEGARATKRRD